MGWGGVRHRQIELEMCVWLNQGFEIDHSTYVGIKFEKNEKSMNTEN